MKKLKIATVASLLTIAQCMTAGGLLTNTNQNIAFLRNPARDAAIGIDGVYSNPAGVAFLTNGLHISINIQNAHQTRTITSSFAPFAYGLNNNGKTSKEFKGEADAPILPSLQAAYNKGDWSFQFGFAVTGGGGKCVFDNGLSSFESIVGLLPMLSQNLDAVTGKLGLGQLGLPTVSQYNMDMYMRGRQYYYGFTFGAARKLDKHWSVYLGARLLYGSSNYYGYVKNIQGNIGGNWVNASETFSNGATQYATAVGTYTTMAQEAAANAQSALAAGDAAAAQQYSAAAQQYAAAAKQATIQGTMLGALGEATQNVTLNCDQTGWGIAPIVGVDYKTGAFNFAAKYEFRTKMSLKNRSANSESAKNIPMLDRYEDDINVREDSPALLTVGAQWSILPQLRVSAGWHHYFDKDAKQFNNHQDKLDGNTNEYLGGIEYDINDRIQVSAGAQKTNYNFTDDYMEDISFNVSSYSFGFGVGIKLNKKLKLNLAYFQTNYGDYTRSNNDYYNNSAIVSHIVGGVAEKLYSAEGLSGEALSQQVSAKTSEIKNMLISNNMLDGSDSFTRTNRVLGVGLDIEL